MKTIVQLILLQILFVCSTYSQDVYVYSEGMANTSDSVAGTQNNPYNLSTLQSLILNGTIGSGTTIFLKGTFSLTETFNLFGSSNLAFDQWPNEIAIIQADESIFNVPPGVDDRIVLFSMNSTTNCTIKNIIFKGSSNLNSKGNVMLNIIEDTNGLLIENVTFQDNRGNQGIALNIYGKGNGLTIKNCTFKDLGWTSDPNATVTNEISSGMIITGNKNDMPFQNVLIEGNTVNDLINGYAECLTVTGNVDGFVFRNNTLNNNKNIGIAMAGHYTITDFATGTPLDASLNQARNGLVELNTVVASVSDVATSAGIYCDGCKDVIIERNKVKNSGAGVSIGCENGGGRTASNIKVINNIFKENIAAGVFLGSSLNEDNTDTSESNQSSVINCEIRNNVFYKNGTDSNIFKNQEVFLGRSNTNNFHNNILYIDNNSRGIVSAILEDNFGNPTYQHVTAFTMSHNLYYRANGLQNNLVVSSPGNILPMPEEAHFGNPEFNDPLQDNFNISITSRAVNNGLPATVITTGEVDYANNQRIYNTTRIDIGAYETNSEADPISPNLGIIDFVFQNNITVYPNPTQQVVIIDINNNYIGEVKVNLFDVKGKQYISKALKKNGENLKVSLNFTELSKGVYTAIINMHTQNNSVKIIKK